MLHWLVTTEPTSPGVHRNGTSNGRPTRFKCRRLARAVEHAHCRSQSRWRPPARRAPGRVRPTRARTARCGSRPRPGALATGLSMTCITGLIHTIAGALDETVVLIRRPKGKKAQPGLTQHAQPLDRHLAECCQQHAQLVAVPAAATRARGEQADDVDGLRQAGSITRRTCLNLKDVHPTANAVQRSRIEQLLPHR